MFDLFKMVYSLTHNVVVASIAHNQEVKLNPQRGAKFELWTHGQCSNLFLSTMEQVTCMVKPQALGFTKSKDLLRFIGLAHQGKDIGFRFIIEYTVSTLTKWIINFFKNLFHFWNYWIFHDLLWYCHISSENIQSVAYDNYDDFQHVNFRFSQKIISLFWGL